MRSKYYDKEKSRVYVARYRERFPEKTRQWVRESYARHCEKRKNYAREKRAMIQNDPVLRGQRNEKDRIRRRKRLVTDPDYRLYIRIRTRILMALQRNDKASTTESLLGCSIKQCRLYIESLWREGMSWENHSHRGWHLDHVVACNKFDLSDSEQQKRCFHYTNLQPLWCLDNWRKDGRPTKTYR